MAMNVRELYKGVISLHSDILSFMGINLSVESKRVLTMAYTRNTQNYWVSGLRPSFGILNTREQCFGNWTCFRPLVRVVSLRG
jgi:hypothetical protein